jgi:hypothetical protein
MKSFLAADFFDLPVGIRCPNYYGSSSMTNNYTGKGFAFLVHVNNCKIDHTENNFLYSFCHHLPENQ